MASSNGCAPMLRSPEAHPSGNIFPACVAFFRPCTSSSCERVPASKNFSINCSSASATISINASRATFTASVMSSGTAASDMVPEPSVANEYAFIETRSITPVKAPSSPSGN